MTKDKLKKVKGKFFIFSLSFSDVLPNREVWDDYLTIMFYPRLPTNYISKLTDFLGQTTARGHRNGGIISFICKDVSGHLL